MTQPRDSDFRKDDSQVRFPMTAHDVRKAYRRWAPFYDFLFSPFVLRMTHHQVANHVNGGAGSVLEVGVGTGFALPLYETHLTITGVDLSPEMLARARRRVEKRGLGHIHELAEMDATELAYPDGHFDMVVAVHVMSVVPDPCRVFRELERVCKPGGEVIIVNHFQREKRDVIGFMERAIAPLSRYLGWHPDMPIAIFNKPGQLLLLKEKRTLKPFGLFTMLLFKKPLSAVGAAE